MKGTLFFFLFVFVTSQYVFSQVGFNNPNPDPNSILDMSAVTDKGLLIPNLNKTQRNLLSSKNPRNNMLVFDPVEKLFYFLNVTDKRWYVLNSWKLSYNPAVPADDIAKSPLLIDNGHAVGIGTTALPTATLEVNGTIKSSGAITTAQSITAASVTSPTINATTLNADNIVTKQNITAGKFSGEGTIPAGGIIMYSGEVTKIPLGWTLCNGNGGVPINGMSIPDLRGKFIVGYDPNDADYSQISKTGGEKKHALSIEEMPRHSHHIGAGNSSLYLGNARNGGEGNHVRNEASPFPMEFDTQYKGGLDNGTEGSSISHESRPPYYTLAYIIKLP